MARHRPAVDLAPFIERFWTVEWALPDGQSHQQRVVGFPSIEMVFEAGQANAWGVARRVLSRQFVGQGSALGVKFKPGGFTALFAVDAATFTDRCVPLAAVHPDLAQAVAPPVEASRGPGAEDIPLVEDTLRAFVASPPRALTTVSRCFRLARRRHSRPSVEQLASGCGMSVRSLERLFGRHVGMPPKWVLRRLRLIDAMAAIEGQVRPDWIRIALDCGYVDQSHFINDFTAQVGISPRGYLKGNQLS